MIVIANGTVVDGTGAAAFAGDVVIEGDRIADIVRRDVATDVSYANAEIIDAAGCLVSPGFIDSHSHSDTYLLIEPKAPSKISQGVTTEINGQCGGSAMPRYGAARLSSDWASMTYPKLADGIAVPNDAPGPTWRSMKEYRELFDALRPCINSVQFVGHNTLRSSVLGYEPLKADADSLKRMGDLLTRELDDGGHGLTTGLIYQPGKYSTPGEVVALAKIAASKGKFYATHMRSEGDMIIEAIDEVLDLVRKTGIRAEISHLKTSGRKNWHKIDDVLRKIDGAVASGELLGSDRYPYCAAGTDLDVVLPDWAGEGGLLKELERLDDPRLRAKIERELNESDRDWSGVMIGGTWSDGTKSASGRTVAELMRDEDRTAGEIVCGLLAMDRGRTGGFFFGMNETNLQKICEMPWIVPGSDASLRAFWGPLGKDHPHPRAYGTMPRFFRLLTGRLEGHGRICSTEEAVKRMTSVPANRFDLKDRGVLRRGAFADIAVWRENDFADKADYIHPHAYASGMEFVFVNGHLSYSANGFATVGAGRLLDE